MFTSPLCRVSAGALLGLAIFVGSTVPASAQGHGKKSQSANAPSYQQQLQQQLQRDQQFLQLQQAWIVQLEQQQQQMMQAWYQQQMQQQQMMQAWLMQRNLSATLQSTPATPAARRPR